jgi:hypothetical protein
LFRWWRPDSRYQMPVTASVSPATYPARRHSSASNLAAYDRITRAVNDKYDVRGSDLSTLVHSCLENGNKLSNNRRKQYGPRVRLEVFDLIEREAEAVQAANMDDALPEEDGEVDNPPDTTRP